MTKEEFYSRALSFDEVGEQVDIFKKEKIKYEQEIKRLNNIIREIESIYQSLCFSSPENSYVFIEQLGEVLQELKGSD